MDKNDQMLRDKDVADLLRISRSSVWRLAKQDKLPRPVKIGASAARWRLSELNNYMADAVQL